MNHHHKCAAVILALFAFSTMGYAQEIIDQQNDPSGAPGAMACSSPPIGNATLLQSFVPTAASLSSVELRLRASIAFPATAFTTTARIRANDPTGAILGESSHTIAGGQAAGTDVLCRFAFDIALTPGQTYLIEWDTPSADILGWVGMSGDPYAAGTAYHCFGGVWPGGETDFNFTTFTAPVARAPEPSDPKAMCDALAKKTDEAVPGRRGHCLGVILRAACRCIAKDRPYPAIVKLRVFQWKVKMLAMFGRLSRDTARDLIDDASDIIELLRKDLPKRRSWRRRTT